MIPVHEGRLLRPADIAAVQRAVRTRVPRLFARRGLITPETAAEMRQWDHGGGFTFDAGVRIEAADRKGLERLLRYCARPLVASERPTRVKPGQRPAYSLPEPRPDGRLVPYLTPLEWLDRVAALIPPPRRHRHRDHGVLVPTVSPGASRDSASWS